MSSVFFLLDVIIQQVNRRMITSVCEQELIPWPLLLRREGEESPSLCKREI